MTTRRNVTSEKTVLDQDETQQNGRSNISPAVPKSVIVKLLGFTAAMVILPIGSYFVTVNTIFRGNATYAGALAALMANVVLIGYVVVAFWDDQSEREVDEAEQKKGL